MTKASKEEIAALEAIINLAAVGLAKTKAKRMFGCHALFANDAVFGLVWKEGRIGVRLPREIEFTKLMAFSGASPWKAGSMTMSHWVLVPPTMHKEKSKLAKWVGLAHSIALESGNKKLAPKSKPTKGKTKGKTK